MSTKPEGGDHPQTETETAADELDIVVAATNAITVPNPVHQALLRDLGPIARRLEQYAMRAEAIAVVNRATADEAAGLVAQIAADEKAVRDNETLSGITDGLHRLHRQWTALRQRFVEPLETSRKAVKSKVIAWQTFEAEKAAAEQRRLQAEADERARRERERLEKEAAKLKTEEKREERFAQAAAVIAPTVVVEAPKVAVRVQRVWVVDSIDEGMFYASLSTRADLRGYVAIDRNRLQRARAANPTLEVPGVTFKQEIR